MEQTLTHDTLAITSTAGWMSYAEFAEEYYETPLPPTETAIIREEDLPF